MQKLIAYIHFNPSINSYTITLCKTLENNLK